MSSADPLFEQLNHRQCSGIHFHCSFTHSAGSLSEAKLGGAHVTDPVSSEVEARGSGQGHPLPYGELRINPWYKRP